jgi:hypothetical protein
LREVSDNPPPRKLTNIRAKKYWRRGRLKQELTRVWCLIVGHDWQPWFFDWPYDVPEYWEEIGEPVRDPEMNEMLTWARGCDRRCGCLQKADSTLAESGVLPGEVDGLYDNPLRRGFRHG